MWTRYNNTVSKQLPGEKGPRFLLPWLTPDQCDTLSMRCDRDLVLCSCCATCHVYTCNMHPSSYHLNMSTCKMPRCATSVTHAAKIQTSHSNRLYICIIVHIYITKKESSPKTIQDRYLVQNNDISYPSLQWDILDIILQRHPAKTFKSRNKVSHWLQCTDFWLHSDFTQSNLHCSTILLYVYHAARVSLSSLKST